MKQIIMVIMSTLLFWGMFWGICSASEKLDIKDEKIKMSYYFDSMKPEPTLPAILPWIDFAYNQAAFFELLFVGIENKEKRPFRV